MFAKIFITLGIIFIILGILIYNGINFLWLGHLPGDINIKRDNIHFIFPITTCLIISLIFSIVIFIISRL